MNDKIVRRRDVWWVEGLEGIGSEQTGDRPVLIIQNDIGNRFSPTVIVAVMTTKPKKLMPTHVWLDPVKNGLVEPTLVMMEQIRTLDKKRLKKKLTQITEEDFELVLDAGNVSVGRGIQDNHVLTNNIQGFKSQHKDDRLAVLV